MAYDDSNLIFLSGGQTIEQNSAIYDITLGGTPSNDVASGGSLSEWQTGVDNVANIFRSGAAGIRDTVDLLTGKTPTSTVTRGTAPPGATQQIDLGMIALAAALYWLVKHG